MEEFFTNLKNMLIDGVGNVIFAILILIVALVVAAIVKSFVIKGLKALKIGDKLSSFGVDSNKAINLAGKIAWFVVFLLFLPAVFTQLKMNSITNPIINLVDKMVGFIPNLIAAGILVAVGVILGDIVKQILTPILKAAKIDGLQSKLGMKSEKTSLTAIIVGVVKALIILFFVLQAISALNMSVLNSVGSVIVAYIPSLLASLLIVLIVLYGANKIEALIVKAKPQSKGAAVIVKIIIYVFGVFMVLSQLKIASTIVNQAFIIILSGVMIAAAIAFGIGGRDFAKHMLDKLEKKIDDNK